jgi:mono/diheme cytochrome c family protein
MRFPLTVAALALLSLVHTSPASAGNLTTGPGLEPLPSLGPVGDGRRLYVELNCYLCHGFYGRGSEGPNLTGAEKGDVSEVLKQGSPERGMPSFKKYATTANISNITAYLGSLGTSKEPTWFDWWEKNPTQ